MAAYRSQSDPDRLQQPRRWRPAALWPGILTSLCLIAAHAGLEGVAQRLSLRVATLGLLWCTADLMTACGVWLLNVLRVPQRPTLESRVQAFSLGWCVLLAQWTLLAVVGAYRPSILWSVLALNWCWWSSGLRRPPTGVELWSALPWSVWCGWLVRHLRWGLTYCVLAAVIVWAGCWALGPVWDVDSEMYHLPNAQFFLQQGALAADHAEPLRNHPGGMVLWYGVGLSLGCEGYAAGLMWLAGIATGALVAGMTARWVGASAGFVALPVYWTGLVVLAVCTTPRVEPAYGLLFLTAISLLQPIVETRRSTWSAIIAAGLCLGTAGAIKYQGLYGWVIIGGWLLYEWIRTPELRTWRVVQQGIGLFLVAAVCVSPWWIRNTWAFGNPVYPMFAGAQTDSLRHGNPHGPHRTLGWDYLVRDTSELFSHPNSFSGPPHHYPHYLFLLLPLWIVCRRHLPAAVIRWIVLGFVYLALADTLAREIRHMYPLFGLWAAATGALLVQLERQFRLRLLIAGIVTALLAFVLLFPARIVPARELFAYLCGATDEQPLLKRIVPGLHPVQRWANEHTPADATVLMCWEARTYRLQRAAITDPGRSTWRTLFEHERTPAEIGRFLRTEGVDYVLFNESALNYDVKQARLLPLSTLATVKAQKKQLIPGILELVCRDHHVSLYRVLPASSSITEPSSPDQSAR